MFRIVAGAALIGAAYCKYEMSKKNKETPVQKETEKTSKIAPTVIQESTQIKDKYTAEMHDQTIATVSKHEYFLPPTHRTFIKGDLAQAVQKPKGYPVFNYEKLTQAEQSSQTQEQLQKSFKFSGYHNGLFFQDSYEAILKGKYVRCKDSAITDMIHTEFYTIDSFYIIDTIVTGEDVNCDTCDLLKIAILRDTAFMAAKNKIHPKYPLSDTPVFDLTNKEQCLEVGDLLTMPESAKKDIIEDNFLACPWINNKKTRLSGEKYQPVGAIVTGKHDESICDKVNSLKWKTYIANMPETHPWFFEAHPEYKDKEVKS